MFSLRTTCSSAFCLVCNGADPASCTQHLRLWWDQPLDFQPKLSVPSKKRKKSNKREKCKKRKACDELERAVVTRRLESSRYSQLYANLSMSPEMQMCMESVLVQHKVHKVADLARLSDDSFAELRKKLGNGLFAGRVEKVRCVLLLSQSQ